MKKLFVIIGILIAIFLGMVIYKNITNDKNITVEEIENIEKIECLNTGTIQNVTPETSVFSIQLQITYREVY